MFIFIGTVLTVILTVIMLYLVVGEILSDWAKNKMKISVGIGGLKRLPPRRDIIKTIVVSPVSYIFNLRDYKRAVNNTLEYANQLYQCPDCKRYNRVYQINFISKFKCVHCDSSQIYQVRRCTDLSADVLEFLASFPDCPQINKKQYRAWWAWYDARERREEIEKANAEIEQIMRHHAESGASNYIKRIYEEGR